MSGLTRDLRQGLRSLIGSPAFTVVTLLCLGLGIGANTTVFTLANALFLRPLPVEDPDSLVRAYTSYEDGLQWGVFSHPDFRDLQEMGNDSVELAAEQVMAVNVTTVDRSERIFGALVSAGYFELLGVNADRGRALLPEDDRETRAVAVLSHSLWRRRFDGDPGVVGRELSLNDRRFTVVGVAPAEFTGTVVGFAPDLWVPLSVQPRLFPGSEMLTTRDERNLLVIGRLAPGVSLERAEGSLDRVFAELARTYPESNEGTSVTLIPEREGAVHPIFRGAVEAFVALLHVLMGLVLLIACANVATLLVSRAARRTQEVAVRLALGASRLRLIRQLVTESLLLALAAGGLGLALAFVLGRLIESFSPDLGFPVTLDLGLDHRVLLFAFGVSVLTGVVFGLAPALQSVKTDLVSALKDRSSGQVRRRSRLQNVLVVAQLSVSLVLLIAAGLFLRGLQHAQSIELGFDPEGVAVASVDLSSHGWNGDRGRRFYRQAVQHLESLPEVRSAAWTMTLPLSSLGGQTRTQPEGHVQATNGGAPLVDYSVVSAGYFETLGIPLVAGRSFDSHLDRADTARKAIVNQTLARRFWPDDSPLGRRLDVEGTPYQVIGVARDGKYGSVGEDATSYLYLPLDQVHRQSMTLAVKTRSRPESFLPTLRTELRRLHGTLALFHVQTLDEHLQASLLPVRAGAWVINAFGLLAVLLAAVGLYGILAYSIGQRSREIGIRMAMGARAASVLRMVLWQGLRLALIGAGIGLILAALLSRLLTHFLYGVDPLDPLTFVAGLALLSLLALGASWLPARRAIRTDPAVVLREA